jgi:short subunit fatty acids transporter
MKLQPTLIETLLDDRLDLSGLLLAATISQKKIYLRHFAPRNVANLNGIALKMHLYALIIVIMLQRHNNGKLLF